MRKRRSPGAKVCNGSTWTVMTISKPQSLCIGSAATSRANVITTTRKPQCFFAKISGEDSRDSASTTTKVCLLEPLRRSIVRAFHMMKRRCQCDHFDYCGDGQKTRDRRRQQTPLAIVRRFDALPRIDDGPSHHRRAQDF